MEEQKQQRQRKFKRTASPKSIQVTERDVQIIRLVDRHRFLQPPHLRKLVGMSYKALARRLMLLYHNHYLDRPRAQIDYYKAGGSKPMVYAIGSRGADLLAEIDGTPRPKVDWTAKNRTVGRLFIEHALLTADILVALEVACEAVEGVRLVPETELLSRLPDATRARKDPFRLGARVKHDGQFFNVGVVPDAVFALDFLEEGKRAHFVLEADRGTMPVVRSNPRDSSIYKKLVVYYQAWRSKKHTELFGMQNFRVLFVTRGRERAANMLAAGETATGGEGSPMFLFGERSALIMDNILTAPWTNGKGKAVTLMD